MAMLTDEQFITYLTLPYEPRGVEFKGAYARTDKVFFAKVVRACLGMANRQDGGKVIIGVDEVNGAFVPTGLSDADLATWRYDDVAAGLSEYADPMVRFDLSVHLFDGKQFVALDVYEFDDLPVLCKRTYNDPRTRHEIVRAGACYVRSQRKPETSEIPTQTEMRELLDLAIDKGVRRFVERARQAGLDITPSSPTSEERFDAQLHELGDEP